MLEAGTSGPYAQYEARAGFQPSLISVELADGLNKLVLPDPLAPTKLQAGVDG